MIIIILNNSFKSITVFEKNIYKKIYKPYLKNILLYLELQTL